ncbi:methyltransferase family protein [Nocardia sp. IBHARD005]|uniref:methyltransferase family protein n=1 Tax=Nocardia sp. IBHARD005 TaxID=3457765 RepID=UPI004057F6F6
MPAFEEEAGNVNTEAHHRLAQMIRGAAVTALLGAVARLRVPDHLADGPLTATELARRCGANPDALERTLRALANVGAFSRIDDRFALNDLAELLRTDSESTLRSTAMTAVDPAF